MYLSIDTQWYSDEWLKITAPLKGSNTAIIMRNSKSSQDVVWLLALKDTPLNWIVGAEIVDHKLKISIKWNKHISLDLWYTLWVCSTSWIMASQNLRRKKTDLTFSRTRPMMKEWDLGLLNPKVVWVKRLEIREGLWHQLANQLSKEPSSYSDVKSTAKEISSSLNTAIETDVVLLEDTKAQSNEYRKTLATVLHWAAQQWNSADQQEVIRKFYYFDLEDEDENEIYQSYLKAIKAIRRDRLTLQQAMRVINAY